MWRRIKIALPIAVGLLVLLWLHSRLQRERLAVPSVGEAIPGYGRRGLEGAEAKKPQASSEIVTSAEPPPGLPADDLERVEGIGPKISAVLRQAGITTYAQLAALDVEGLRTILGEAGIRLADPGTWPQQATLAAAGDWEALNGFQGRLRGGRRA
jgi:predicted flap endonuclease-1-like 5' DNA nuclease